MSEAGRGADPERQELTQKRNRADTENYKTLTQGLSTPGICMIQSRRASQVSLP